ncbi:hypothetical protein LSTR_LSTR008751 [Laodelphax striatellus]|uniref:Uncharacterized protein n=1 Tax=Laodelphax striatellus TaxID=195883 RepID=A0A482XQY0_LAOST|nr:hypothetical protein LSTR_LSTR008751 [Laodelphax striatellus]
MQSLLSCRKRSRSCEEESSEFAPLSKRINNIHINNPFFSLQKPIELSQQESISAGMSSEAALWSERQRIQNSMMNPVSIQEQMHYTPDLSLEENPHYYEKNRLLFNLFLERIQRNPH